MWADQAFIVFMAAPKADGPIIDIGAGKGEHTEALRVLPCEIWPHRFEDQGDYLLRWYGENLWGGVWCSHVLEHSPNPGLFLKKIFRETKNNAPVAITVPPLKHQIVGGHVTLWNMGLLLYQMILAGFDCSQATCMTYDYNLSVIVRKTPITDMPELKNDFGDIEKLAVYFPLPVKNAFDGRIEDIRHDYD